MTKIKEQDAQIGENKMGVMGVNKLLISMSLPIMISMLISALYNIVDSIFVAEINQNALTAVSLAFPIQSLMISVAVGTGVGVNALLARYLGEKRQDKANLVAGNGIVLSIICCLVFVVIGIFASETFMVSLTGKAEPEDMLQIQEYGITYLTIISTCSIGLFTQIMFERLLQSTGKSFYTMITQGTGAIINIILDPIFIFGYFGFPKMGVAGAAIATVTGQVIAGILAVIFHLTRNKEIQVTKQCFIPDFKMIIEVYKIGLPSIIMQSIGSVMTYGMNLILGGLVVSAQTAFGIYFKLQSFIFMPIFGLNNGMVPIIAYNYGAGKPDRIHETIKLSIKYAVAIMAVGTIIMEVFPKQLLQLFKASDELMGIGVVCLRVLAICFVFAAVSIISASVFQAVGYGTYSMYISIIRQLVVLLPMAYLLSLTGDVDYVWWSFVIAEVVAIICSLIYLKKIYRKVIYPSKIIDNNI